MSDALALARRALGADAMVLNTRTIRRGGFLGFGAKSLVEVTAAAAAPGTPRPRPAAPRPRSASGSSAGPRMTDNGPAGDLIRRTYRAARAELEDASGEGRGGPGTPIATTQASPMEPPVREGEARLATGAAVAVTPLGAGDTQLADELRAVRGMVQRVLRNQGGAPREDLPQPLFDQYLALLQQELEQDLAEQAVREVQSRLDETDLADDEAVRRAMAEALAHLLPTCEDGLAARVGAAGEAGEAASDADAAIGAEADGDRGAGSEEGPRVIALVGPTGVGKTTTIAKLAAHYKLEKKRRVGLITIDTYRIAAVDQLRTYAQIIGVPLEVVSNEQAMRDAIRDASDCDVVLIDTAGRSQRDDPRLSQLASMLEAASPHEVHLVLSSTATQPVLLDVAERFGRLPINHVLFTKLDEAVSFGVLVNVARKVGRRLSYLTTGQEVPHQIEPGSAQRLASLVMGESCDSSTAGEGASYVSR